MSDSAGNRVSLANVPSGFGIAVGTKSAGLITVAVNGEQVVMLAPRDLTIADGDPLSFIRVGSQWMVAQRYGTAPPAAQPDNPPPPKPKPTVTVGTRVFTPVETRSRQGSKWRNDTDDVYQGQYGGNGNHIGCAFYGGGPRGLAGTTVTGASVRIRRKSAGGITAAQDTTLRLVTQRTRPSGAPTLGASTDGPNLKWGQTTTVAIPTSWAQAMVDGTAGGLAVFESDGSPYVILTGRASYSSSFALTIKWRRVT